MFVELCACVYVCVCVSYRSYIAECACHKQIEDVLSYPHLAEDGTKLRLRLEQFTFSDLTDGFQLFHLFQINK